MHIVINGSGPMADELRAVCDEWKVVRADWHYDLEPTDTSIVVNFGKRSTLRVYRWCIKNGVVLIQGTTGQDELFKNPECPVVLAPNLALPVAYFLEKVAPTMRELRDLGLTAKITEEHQKSKEGASGTALALAKAVGLLADKVESRREGDEPHMDLILSFVGEGISIVTRVSVVGRRLYAEGALQLADRLLNGDDGSQFNIRNQLYHVHDFM